MTGRLGLEFIGHSSVVIELDVSDQPEEDCRTSVKYVTETLGLRLTGSGGTVAAAGRG